MHLFKKISVIFLSFVISLITLSSVSATVLITTATGGSAISADTNATNGTAIWTILTGPIITEGRNRDFSSASGTFVINAPSGFVFNTGASVTATITRVAGTGTCFSFSSTTVVPTSSTITFNQSGRDQAGSTRCRVVFSNIQVRPTSGTPLASGNITKTGTTVVSGITNGTTNLGTLTESAGAINHFSFSTIDTQTAGTAFNTTITGKDAYNNTVTNFTGTVNLSTNAVTIIPSVSGTFINGVRNESVTLTQAGSNKTITAIDPISGKTGTSGAFMVNPGAFTKLQLLVPGETASAGSVTGKTGVPSAQTVGVPFVITANSVDANWNIATSADTVSITSSDGSAALPDNAALIAGVKNFNITLNGAGEKTITATDVTDGTKTSNTSSLITVNRAATTTSMTTSDSSSVYGMDIAFTATVTPASGSAPSGTVTFKDGDVTIGAANLNGANPGTATLIINNLSVSGSPHSITAVYEGDSNYVGSASGVVLQTITAKNLTIMGITADDKVYDGAVAATLNVAGATLVGVISGDVVTLDTGSVVGTFADKNAGSGKTVTTSGFSLSGVDASKYTLIQPTVTASVTAKNLTITGITAENKPYDGNTTATLIGAPGTLVGIVTSDVVTIFGTAIGNFSDPNVGIGKTVTISGLTISGADSPNYILLNPTTTADIISAGLTITGVTASNKIYDGSVAATLNASSAALLGVNPGEDVTLSGIPLGVFSDKNVGSGKTVTISGFTISGADASKYTLIQPTATANITTLSLTVTGITANNKTYDGFTTATLNVAGATLVGVISPDVTTLDTGSAIGNFSDPAIGTGKTVNISGLTLSGVDSPNYGLIQPTTTADITSAVVPIVATRFTIVQPVSTQVGNIIPVTVRAEDNLGNLDITYNNTVTLVATGSASGAGVVTVTNGIGTKDLIDSTPETVDLFLLDIGGTGLDVSSTKQVMWTPAPPLPSVPASTARSAPLVPLSSGTVHFVGRAFPGADVSITSFTGDTVPTNHTIISSSDGSFDIPLTGILPGIASYSLTVIDPNGVKSQTKIFSIDVTIGETNTISNIIVPPTASLLRDTVTAGDNLVVTGYGFPGSTVRLFVDGVQSGNLSSVDNSGKYKISFNTLGIGFGPHSITVNETISSGGSFVSDYSIGRSLNVSKLFNPKTDLNNDGKVDIQDWSIFLSKWNTPGATDKSIDLNGDGTVDIADFSIMLRAIQK